MTFAASLPSNTQSLQDATSAYEREKTRDSRVGTPFMAAQGAALIAVGRVVKLNIEGQGDSLASPSDGTLMVDHDPDYSNMVDSTPALQMDDREELRKQMSAAARAAVEDARVGVPDNTQI